MHIWLLCRKEDVHERDRETKDFSQTNLRAVK